MYHHGPAAISDARISVTARITVATLRQKNMTGRVATMRSASTTPRDGGLCVGLYCSVTCYVEHAATKPARKLITSFRHAEAARFGHSTTYKGCVLAAMRARHGAKRGLTGIPVILPNLAAAQIRGRGTCEKPQVLNFFRS